jgi:sRNA-binding carbon storage regulator CsrA
MVCRPGERVRIGQDVDVQIVEVEGRSTRIVVVAPRDVPILRLLEPKAP